MATTPYEIALSPAQVYVAPVGEPFPTVNETPGGNWVLVGTEGDKNYTEDGVVIRRSVDIAMIRTLGSTATRKAGVTAAGFEVEFTVLDISAEEMLLAFGGDPDDITDTAAGGGEAGFRSFDMPTDPDPIGRAVLVRAGVSAYGDGFASQFQIYSAIQTGSAEGTFRKDQAVGFRHVWTAIESASGLMTFVTQDAAAT